MKLTLKNRKQEIFDAYVEGQKNMEEMKQQQTVLFSVAGILIVMWLV